MRVRMVTYFVFWTNRHTEEESGDGGMLVEAGGDSQCKNPGRALTGRRACDVITEVRRGEIHQWASGKIHARSLVGVQNIPEVDPKPIVPGVCGLGGTKQVARDDLSLFCFLKDEPRELSAAPNTKTGGKEFWTMALLLQLACGPSRNHCEWTLIGSREH